MEKIEIETKIRALNLYLEGFSYREIGEKLNIGPSTVSNIINEFKSGSADYLPAPDAGYLCPELVEAIKYMKGQNLTIQSLIDRLEIAIALRGAKIDPELFSKSLKILQGTTDPNEILESLLTIAEKAKEFKMPVEDFVISIIENSQKIEKINKELEEKEKRLEDLKKEENQLRNEITSLKDEGDILKKIKSILDYKSKNDIDEILKFLAERNVKPGTISGLLEIINSINSHEIPQKNIGKILNLLNYLYSIGLDPNDLENLKERISAEGNIEDLLKKAFEFYKNRENLEKERDELNQQVAQLRKDINSKNSDLKHVEEKLQEKNKELQKLNEDVESKKNLLDMFDRENKDLIEKNIRLENRNKELTQDIENIAIAYLAKNQKLNQLNENIEKLEERNRELEKRNKELENENKKLDDEKKELERQKNELNIQIQYLEKELMEKKDYYIIANALESLSKGLPLTAEMLSTLKNKFGLMGNEQTVKEGILNLIISKFGKEIGLIYEEKGEHRLLSASEYSEFKKNEQKYKEFAKELNEFIMDYPSISSGKYPMIKDLVRNEVSNYWEEKYNEIKAKVDKKIERDMIPSAFGEAINKISSAFKGEMKEDSFTYYTICSVCKKPTEVEIKYKDLGTALRGSDTIKVKCKYGHDFELPLLELFRGMVFPEQAINFAENRVREKMKFKFVGRAEKSNQHK